MEKKTTGGPRQSCHAYLTWNDDARKQVVRLCAENEKGTFRPRRTRYAYLTWNDHARKQENLKQL